MNRKMTAGTAAALVLLAPLGGAVVAQEGEAAPVDPSLQSELKPGLHINADESTGSLLAQAARDRTSIVIGDDNGAVDNGYRAPVQRDVVAVKEGDTLWGICSTHFGDPYVWPRVWSYNPKVTNPHWIYPGDVLALTPPAAIAQAPAATPFGPASAGAPQPIGPRRGTGEILIRNRGFVDKETLKKSGKLVGSQREVSMLGQFDEAYVEFEDVREVMVGAEYAVFQELEEVESIEDRGSELGVLVEILGSARVLSYDKDKEIARVAIEESLQPIERGAMIGPLSRKFQVVAASPNDRELKGHIVAFLDPVIIAGSQQVAFVDRGTEQGVREGNRFFVVEKRDAYRKSLEEDDDRDGYPFEVLAELRVVEARPNTSTCLVTASVRELEVGAEVEMVKGY